MRRRIYTRNLDGAAEAQKIREDFYAKPMASEKTFGWTWPTELVEVGECAATLYRSDKWKKKGVFEDYKHKSEAEQRLFIVPSRVQEFLDMDLPIVGPKEKVPSGFL